MKGGRQTPGQPTLQLPADPLACGPVRGQRQRRFVRRVRFGGVPARRFQIANPLEGREVLRVLLDDLAQLLDGLIGLIRLCQQFGQRDPRGDVCRLGS